MDDEYRRSATPPRIELSSSSIWTIALAGGEATRHRRIPKQFWQPDGGGSLLEHALDRLAGIAAPARTIAAIGRDHLELAAPQLRGRADHVVRQPAERGTSMALYVALAMLRRWAPNAVVVVTPTDAYAEPVARFAAHVRRATELAAVRRDDVVVLEPGAPYTAIACGTVDAFWALGQATQPHLLDILDSLVPLIGTPEESEALDFIYLAYLPVSFSREMLARAPRRVVALSLDGVEWSEEERSRTPLAAAVEHALGEPLAAVR